MVWIIIYKTCERNVDIQVLIICVKIGRGLEKSAVMKGTNLFGKLISPCKKVHFTKSKFSTFLLMLVFHCYKSYKFENIIKPEHGKPLFLLFVIYLWPQWGNDHLIYMAECEKLGKIVFLSLVFDKKKK